MKKIVTAIFAAMVSFGAFAANYYWNPDVTTGNWNDAANWCTDAACTTPSTKAPGNKDAVYFDGTKISSAVSVDCYNATGFTITINLTGVSSGLVVTLNGAKMTASSKLASGTTLVFDGGSQISYGGDATTATGSTLRIKGGTTFNYNSQWNVYNSTLEILDGSVVTLNTHLYTKNSTILIDNATLHVRHNVYNYGGSTTPDTFIFKGENPVLRSGRDYFRGQTSSGVCNLNFEVPVGGYREPPVQFLDGTTKIFSSSSNSFSYNVNVIASSPAFTSTQYKTDCPLVYSFAGITRSFCKFNSALNAAGASALRYCTGDGVTETSTDADSVAIYAMLGSGSPATPPSCDYSKGVALVSVVTNTMTATASRRTVTVSSSVTSLATINRTRARLLEGEEFDEAALTEVASANLTALGKFSFQWTAPNNQLNKTYYFQIILETLDANDEVVYSEKTPVKACMTIDDSTYTWSGVDGDWSDPASWTASDESDRADYPDSNYATVVFPAGSYTVTVDRACNVGTFSANSAGSDITFVAGDGMTLSDKFNVNTAASISCSGESHLAFSGLWTYFNCAITVGGGNRLIFDGCKVRTSNFTSSDKGETIFKDSSVTSTTVYLGGGGSRSVKTVTLDNSDWTTSDNVYICYGSTGGRMIFKGADAKLLLNTAAKSFQANINNSNFTFDFEVPVGGYTTAPIQTCASKTTTAFNDSKTGVVNYFNILPESPALQVKGTFSCLLMDWKGKTASSNYINKNKCNFDGVGNNCNAFLFNDASKPTQISIQIRNEANEDCLKVVGNPENYGVPTPAYGLSFGHTANVSVPFSLAATSVTNAGVACEYRGYLISNVTDIGTYAFTGSGSESSFTYTHNANAAGQVTLLWSRSYALTVDRNNVFGGTVSTSGGFFAEGSSVTVTATPASADGYVFRHWDGDIGDADATSSTITVAMDQVRNVTAVFGMTRYVATTGNDLSNNGSESAPFASPQKAYEVAQDNDIIQIAAGTYTLTNEFLIAKAVTIVGVPDANGVKPVIDGYKDKSNSYRTLKLDNAGAIVRNLRLYRGYKSGDNGGGGLRITANGGTVEDCEFVNCYSATEQHGGSLRIDGPGAVRRCLITGGYTVNGNGNGSGAYINHDNAVVEGCVFYNNSQNGRQGATTKIGAVYLNKGTVSHCTIAGNNMGKAGGIYVAAGAVFTDSIVYGNVAQNDTTVGAPNWQMASGAYVTNICTTVQMGVYSRAGMNLVRDPLFKDAANNDYSLKIGSCAIDASSVTFAAGEKDIAGNDRTIGAAADLGAYEFDQSRKSIGIEYSVDGDESGSTLTYRAVPSGGLDLSGTTVYWNFSKTVPTAGSHAATGVNGSRTVTPGIWSISVSAEVNGVTYTETVADIFTIYALDLKVVKNNPNAALPYDTWENAAATIEDALVLTKSGSVVTIDDGTYEPAAPIVFNKRLTVQSRNGPAKTILNGKAARMLFDMQHADGIARGFTVYNGKHDKGGGISMSAGLVENCVVTNCQSGGNAGGGGIYMSGGTVTRCVIAKNRTTAGSGDGHGVLMEGDNAILENSLVWGNHGDNWDKKKGGGISISKGLVRNCTIIDNNANTAGGVYVSANGRIIDSIIYGNTTRNDTSAGAPNWVSDSANVTNCFSLVQFGTTVGGKTLYGNPGFIDIENRDYHLSGASACKNAAWGTVSFSSLDLDGKPRLDGPAMDLGCYEVDGGQFAVEFRTTQTGNIDSSSAEFVMTCSQEDADLSDTQAYWTFDGRTPTASDYDAVGTNVTHSFTAGRHDVKMTVVHDGQTLDPIVHLEDVVVYGSKLYVDAASTAAALPYNGWANAASNIVDVLDLTTDGTDIYVACGTYETTSVIDIQAGVRIHGIANAAGEKPLVQAKNTKSHRIFKLNSESALVEGFRIARGFVSGGGAGAYVMAGTVRDCIVYGCSLDINSNGAGIYLFGNNSFASCCIVSNCQTALSSKGYGGGGVYVGGGRLDSSLVVGCKANGASGILVGNGVVANCTVISNSTVAWNTSTIASHPGVSASNGKVVNCIIRGNISGSEGRASQVDGMESCFRTNAIPWTYGTGCITGDPCFVDEANGDYRLVKGSPCLNAGQYFPDWMTTAKALGGTDRVKHVRHTRKGEIGFVDLGAYESHFLPGRGTTLMLK